VVALSAPGTGTSIILDVPEYVSHAAAIVNHAVIATATPVPDRGELRYPFR
jgi:hypothetical protein